MGFSTSCCLLELLGAARFLIYNPLLINPSPTETRDTPRLINNGLLIGGVHKLADPLSLPWHLGSGPPPIPQLPSDPGRKANWNWSGRFHSEIPIPPSWPHHSRVLSRREITPDFENPQNQNLLSLPTQRDSGPGALAEGPCQPHDVQEIRGAAHCGQAKTSRLPRGPRNSKRPPKLGRFPMDPEGSGYKAKHGWMSCWLDVALAVRPE